MRARGFYSNPFADGLEFAEQRGMRYFWERNEDSFQRVFELKKPHRQKDRWFFHVLQQHRYGREDWETYCFVHGLPTLHAGSWLPELAAPTCAEELCHELAQETWPRMQAQQKTWAARATLECDICKAERKRRCCVAIQGNHVNEKKHVAEAFVHAPCIHPFNYPKYHAQQLRSIIFAKAKHRRLLWLRAHDWPIASGDEDLSKADLVRLRRNWLQLHDKLTGGIMGLLSLVRGLPMRLTGTEDASKKS